MPDNTPYVMMLKDENLKLLRRVVELSEQRNDLLAALQVVLDQVDYTYGNCRMNEMVGAVLGEDVIAQARAAIAKARGE